MTPWSERRFESADALVDALLGFLEGHGRTRYDEAVTQFEHALQAGALAQAEGAPDALVAAALLHDIGHLLLLDERTGRPGLADRDLEHEVVGARFLRRWFGPEVSSPVALHVRAKRYLVGSDPAYARTLSPASTRSLVLQGGPLTGATLRGFRRLPHADAAIAVRRWDDRAKVPGLAVPPTGAFRPVLRRVLRLPG